MCLLAGPAGAGGLDLSGQHLDPLLAEGTAFTLQVTSIDPSITGRAATGAGSGDSAPRFMTTEITAKTEITPLLHLAAVFDEPFGIKTLYSRAGAYPGRGAGAEIISRAFTLAARYDVTPDIALIGGIRSQSVSFQAMVPLAGFYGIRSETHRETGFVAGAAIDLGRSTIAAVYNSAIEYRIPAAETGGAAPGASMIPVATPQSVNLSVSAEITPATTLTARARWVDWSGFEIAPRNYAITAGMPLLSYGSDTVTYALDLTHAITDHWSVDAALTLENATGGAHDLRPVDGFVALGAGVTWQRDIWALSGAVHTVQYGDTETGLGRFSGSRATHASVKFGLAL